MEIPVPSLESIKAVWTWTTSQVETSFKVMRDPVAILSDVDLTSTASIIKALQFAAFPILLLAALDIPVSVTVEKIRTSIGVVGYFVYDVFASVLLIGIVVGAQRAAAVLVRGKGSLEACVISTLYGTAFWPIAALPGFTVINYRDFVGKDLDTPAAIFAFVAVGITLFLVFVLFLSKYVPMARHVHKVGRLRGVVIVLLVMAISGALMNMTLGSFQDWILSSN